MNLEQIKETQEILNHHLSKVLEELRAVVNFIAGEDIGKSIINPEEVDNRDYTNGILEKIAYSQQENNELLNKLSNQVNKLIDGTYNREELANCNVSK